MHLMETKSARFMIPAPSSPDPDPGMFNRLSAKWRWSGLPVAIIGHVRGWMMEEGKMGWQMIVARMTNAQAVDRWTIRDRCRDNTWWNRQMSGKLEKWMAVSRWDSKQDSDAESLGLSVFFIFFSTINCPQNLVTKQRAMKDLQHLTCQ